MDKTIVAFLDYIRYERNYSELTRTSYQEALLQFEDFSRRETGSFNPGAIDLDTVRLWMKAMKENHKAASSIKQRVSALRSYIRYLRKRGILDRNPLELLRVPKAPKKLPSWVTAEQMDRIIDAADYDDDFEGQRERLVIDMLYQTGMRQAELLGLRDSDIDLDRRQLKVLGKGNKERLIPFGPELESLIRHYLELRRKEVVPGTTEKFLVDRDGNALKGSALYNMVRARLSEIPTLDKRSPHVLRHSFATAMLTAGADLMAVKELMGHASLDSTEVYTHITPQEILSNYKQAHPRATNFKKKGD